ncbi:MAG: YlxR family protein [Gemmatimonadota bacterium]|nr:MAG: YlxR family protein [Gemmatimonadota bacterium]
MKRGHIPYRMCVGCRSVKPKREFLRCVRHGDGSVTIDRGQRFGGRGFYLCTTLACVQKALKKNSFSSCLNRTSFMAEASSLCGLQTQGNIEV